MKLKTSIACSLALTQGINGHYIFNRLILNNKLSEEFQYVRDVTPGGGSPPLFAKAFPIYDPADPAVVCGRNASKVLNPTIQTARIYAGDDVGFMVSGPWMEGDVMQPIFHEGPGQVFLSKLPEELESLNDYDGSGDWFKIAYAGPKNSTTWTLYYQYAMNFTVPETTPPGKYLMRMEQFMPSARKGGCQFFVSCAHVEIVGQGGGKPTQFTRFPNAYSIDEPSVWFHEEGTSMFPKNISVYIEPKPPVWRE
ncbi:hypothetical protein CC78DRAFT_546012 [Lojkania enalia]|uniref:lytic cellulose monooxygenase (C4-dehydrogenating) n=1 Tax=Lojkania enalia TaxID=147567 RepID=A0A9P4K9W2_9PLEO|nr:hypothetical protein CC78DRAFT_546012 [Didymosphaeria enalia]